jgi:hypothetical protein
MTLVGIKSDKATVAEMYGGSGEVGTVAEMLTDPKKLADLVPLAGLGEKASSIAEAMEDDKPQFPVVRVESGWSNNGRLWTGAQLRSIAEQVNALEPVGHLGHIPDNEAGTAFPDPQTTWLGAIVKQEPSQLKERMGEMVDVFYIGGYNHPGAKIRSLWKARAVRGISWWGNGVTKPIPGKGVEVTNFVVKAVDWARKLGEGMPTSSIVTVTGEMEGVVDKELSQVTPEEFKKENPNGYALLVREAQDEQQTTISEMEEKVKDGDKAKSLLTKACEAIGIDDPDKLVEELVNLKTKVGEKANAMVKTALDTLLEEKIPNEERRALARRLLPVGEMEAAAADCKTPEDVTKLVGEMTDKAFNEDDIIKGIVSEMTPPVVRRREELKSGASGLDDNPYVGTRERVTMS